jgi:hypothetical protein
MAHHSLLTEMAELFGVLFVIAILSTISFTLIIVILETSSLKECKLKVNLLKTSLFKKYSDAKANFARSL